MQVSDVELADILIKAGVPKQFVDLSVAFDANTRVGNVDIISNSVEVLKKLKPQPIQDFLDINCKLLIVL